MITKPLELLEVKSSKQIAAKLRSCTTSLISSSEQPTWTLQTLKACSIRVPKIWQSCTGHPTFLSC